MINTKQNYIYIALIIATFLLCAMLFVGLFFNNQNAYADYVEDIQNNQDAIINFNQIFNAGNLSTTNRGVTFTFTNNSSQVKFVVNNNTGAYYFAENLISLVVGHKYLIFTDNDNFSIRIVGNNGNVSAYTNKQIVQYASGNVGVLLKESTPNGTYYVNYNIIDLTYMFGSGNEPNLNQCQNIFTADYYPYNAGSPMSFSSINAYNDALQDIFSSYKYNLSMNALSYYTYAVQYQNQSANFDYNTTTEQWYFQNTFAVPLFTTLNSGAQVKLDYWFYAPNLSGNYYLNVMVWTGNEYQSIYTSTEIIDTSQAQTMTFTLPINVDTLYFNIVNNNSIDTTANFVIFKFDVKASQLDINSMIHNSYDSGYNRAKDYYSNGYQVGGELYNEIYNAGYQAAQNASAETFADKYYTFPQFIGALFDVPVTIILSLLDFNVLGFSMKTLVLSILTITITFAIVRFVLARKEE